MAQIYEIRASPGKGEGVFATKFIPRSTLIMSDNSIFPTSVQIESNPIKLYVAVLALSPPVRAQYLDLAHTTNVAQLHVFRQLAMACNTGQHAISDSLLDEAGKASAIFEANAFCVGESNDGDSNLACIALQATRMNHSCLPNAHHEWNAEACKLDVYARSDIQAGEEITISYIDPLQSRERRVGALQTGYDFQCDCVACDLGTIFGRQSLSRRAQMQACREMITANPRDGHLDAVDFDPMEVCFTALCTLMEDEGLTGPWQVEMHAEMSERWAARAQYPAAIARREKAIEASVLCSGEDGRRTKGQRQLLEQLKALRDDALLRRGGDG
ncbi:hypothetical protein LTR08_004523 [Meristemomyces frigidus]|nr:hypothetical protein LTR08_004523 [Meristemomyces frigidus]